MWSRGDGARAIETLQAVVRGAAGPDARLRSAGVHAARVRTGRRRGRGARSKRRAPATPTGRCCDRSGRCCAMRAISGDRQRCSSRWCATTRPICSRPTRSARPTRGWGAGRRPGRCSSACSARRRTPRRPGTISARCICPRTVRPTRVEALSRAVAINPDLATAHNGLGVAYARLGQTDARRRAVAESAGPPPGLRRRALQPRAHAAIKKVGPRREASSRHTSGRSQLQLQLRAS